MSFFRIRWFHWKICRNNYFPIKLWMMKCYEFCPDCSTAIIGVILDTADWPRAICWCSKLSTAVRLFRDTDRATTPITFSSRTWINHSLQRKSFRKSLKLSTLTSSNIKCKLGLKLKLVFDIHLNLWHWYWHWHWFLQMWNVNLDLNLNWRIAHFPNVYEYSLGV